MKAKTTTLKPRRRPASAKEPAKTGEHPEEQRLAEIRKRNQAALALLHESVGRRVRIPRGGLAEGKEGARGESGQFEQPEAVR